MGYIIKYRFSKKELTKLVFRLVGCSKFPHKSLIRVPSRILIFNKSPKEAAYFLQRLSQISIQQYKYRLIKSNTSTYLLPSHSINHLHQSLSFLIFILHEALFRKCRDIAEVLDIK